MKSFAVFFVCLNAILIVYAEPSVSIDQIGNPQLTKKKQEILPPCQACKVLSNSFKKGMERTSRGKFDGGDALWEESRQGSYANSEVRLIEIQEKLCSDEDKASDQCHRLAEEHEALLEDWWFHQKASSPDLYYFLCIDKLKVCCPQNHYGPECKPCSGGLVNPCNGHGQCKGGGTRKGSGQCRCEAGYAGEMCEKCKIGYYNDTSSGDTWKCAKCDTSCKAHCREAGPKGCEVCADGHKYDMEFGCVDVDECIQSSEDPCKHGTFCVNSIGSYRCVECDKACEGCTGDGPDMCKKCAKDYVFQDPMCVENKEFQRSVHVEVARYATYLGLCVATFIILRRSYYVAAIIGVFVAIYIGLSEYTVAEWESRNFIKSIKALKIL